MACRITAIVVDSRHPRTLADKFPVRADRADDWAALRDEYTRAVRSEEGNVLFEWATSLAEPDTFVLVEGFHDAAAGAAHTGTRAFQDFVERAPDIVARQPQIIYVEAPELAGWGPMGEIRPRS
jgi:quinol monooxygenase YgiN